MTEFGRFLDDSYIDKYDSKKYIHVYEHGIVVNGGDGTLIKAIHKHKDKNIPFYGINAGTVGFMMHKKIVPLNKCEIIKVHMIHIKVKTKNSEIKEYQAFNEICFGGSPKVWGKFKIKERDDMFGSFNGSGIIVSTPQGSTGLNKSNSGNILPLKSDLWSITGAFTSRKIDYIISTRPMNIEVQSRQPVELLIDGTNKIIDDVISIEIKKGSAVELVFNDYRKFKKKRRL